MEAESKRIRGMVTGGSGLKVGRRVPEEPVIAAQINVSRSIGLTKAEGKILKHEDVSLKGWGLVPNRGSSGTPRPTLEPLNAEILVQ